jgi:hypothetical protein
MGALAGVMEAQYDSLRRMGRSYGEALDETIDECIVEICLGKQHINRLPFSHGDSADAFAGRSAIRLSLRSRFSFRVFLHLRRDIPNQVLPNIA